MTTGWSGPGNSVRWGGHAIRNATRAKLYIIAEWLYDKTPHQTDEREMWTIVECAVNAGAIEFAESLLPPNRRIMDYVYTGATPEALRWIFDAGLEEDLINNQDAAAMAFRVAGRSGDLELTQRIAQLRNPRKRNTQWPTQWELTLENACSRGDLPMVEWMMKHPLGKRVCKHLKNGDDFTLTELLRGAAKSGSVEVLEYVHKKGFTDENASALLSAAREGHVKCLEWLFKRIPMYTHPHSACDVVHQAANNGHLSVLQFVHPRCIVGSSFLRPNRNEDSPNSPYTGGLKPVKPWTMLQRMDTSKSSNGFT